MTLPKATIRATPSDFVVEEIPAYEPSGEGEHLFVRFRKTGLTTLMAVERIAAALSADARAAGFAGMKDRHAVTTQTASFPWPLARDDAAIAALDVPDIEILEARRHQNKLKTGHLRGNRFTITLRDIEADALDGVEASFAEAGRRGVPNAYGEQRFGRDADNAERALAWLRGDNRARPRGKKQQRLLVSALQSAMFNRVLSLREERWDRVLCGDLAHKHDTGGIFLVAEPELADAEERAARGEICATGPMFGMKMRWPEGEPGDIERRVLEESVGSLDIFRPVARIAEGARRPFRLPVAELGVTRASDGLVVTFMLPKGGYATTVLGAACSLATAGASRAPGPEERAPRD